MACLAPISNFKLILTLCPLCLSGETYPLLKIHSMPDMLVVMCAASHHCYQIFDRNNVGRKIWAYVLGGSVDEPAGNTTVVGVCDWGELVHE